MNDQEFLDFWKSVQWPQEQTIHYRLYYDDQGQPLFYSHTDKPGKYIEVTPEQYALQDLEVRVVDGVLKPRKKPRPLKLVPSDQGTPCDPGDVSVVVSADQLHQRWKLRTNEQN